MVFVGRYIIDVHNSAAESRSITRSLELGDFSLVDMERLSWMMLRWLFSVVLIILVQCQAQLGTFLLGGVLYQGVD